MQKRIESPLVVVYGGQWGSEGKGQVLAAIVRDAIATNANDIAHNAAPVEEFAGYGVRVGGPNAGHTVRATDGEMVKIQSIPSMCYAHPEITPVISQSGMVRLVAPADGQ